MPLVNETLRTRAPTMLSDLTQPFLKAKWFLILDHKAGGGKLERYPGTGAGDKGQLQNHSQMSPKPLNKGAKVKQLRSGLSRLFSGL